MTKGEGIDPGQHSSRKAVLVLADGTVFEGETFGAEAEVSGEVVFNTSMSGYQEILTDPSYRGQIVVMTYPLIGNYGINAEDVESRKPWVNGFVVRECSPIASRSEEHTSELQSHSDLVCRLLLEDRKSGT